jgi:subtilisin family serine protease
VIALLVGLAALGSGLGTHAQTVTTPTVLPRQPGLTVPEYVAGQVLVLFQPGRVPLTEAGATSQVERTLAAAGVSAGIETRLEDPNGFVLTLTSAPTEITGEREAAALTALRARPEVRAADLNFVRTLHATPNDPGYPNQWAYRHIAAPAAWDTAQALGVTVAVLDTGLDMNHPEFRGRIAPGYDYVNNDPDPSDDNGHGTHVAGTIGAATNNGVGVASMAWVARVMPVKVADAQGRVNSADWINGVVYARTHGARVINMSFGGPGSSGVEQATINDAWNAGLVIVASSGNSAQQGNPVNYPASYDNVVSVGATSAADRRASYSEYNNRVDLVAPGGDGNNATLDQWILSTIPNGYGLASGTSQAAPHVAGLAALMFSTANVWTNDTVVRAMQSTATDLGPAGRDDEYGYGLINAERAVAAAGNPPGPPTATPRPPPPTVPPPTVPPPPTVRPPTAGPTNSPPPATVTPLPGPTVQPGCLFRDVCPADLFYPYIAHLVQLGAVSGYGTEFRPFNDLTRGQGAKMAVLALGGALANPSAPTFADVAPVNPFYIYVETAAARDMAHGYPCGGPGEPCPGQYFRPFLPVTRAQLAKIVVVARGWTLLSPEEATFTDVPLGSPLAPYVETIAARNIVTGYPCGTAGEPCDPQNRAYFRPLAPSTRAQAAKIVDTARTEK